MYQTFETEHRVRPDDIDMYRHVHNSKYLDYVLAARYEQMDRFYGMSLESFLQKGYGWLVKSVHINYKRALTMGEYFVVRTGIESINENGCRVRFTINSKASNKTCADGWFDFVMIDMQTGKSAKVPADIISHYNI
ncbi:thioesterase [Mucilaginibacter sp. PPCGB 2223]|uniref:acyl-CoA thioesterase n=1 Tax=Mucilaginibacter sp. PPCGB 2223 TaxID=1886027 RepID=UPI000825336F|nr:acyl-CoA thioesterase [Mucilaginibacter sp. PPCGB 2223]OCX53493.1 thioesterase [Mucilaginibacter sp. PPCGB 2223]